LRDHPGISLLILFKRMEDTSPVAGIHQLIRALMTLSGNVFRMPDGTSGFMPLVGLPPLFSRLRTKGEQLQQYTYRAESSPAEMMEQRVQLLYEYEILRRLSILKTKHFVLFIHHCLQIRNERVAVPYLPTDFELNRGAIILKTIGGCH